MLFDSEHILWGNILECRCNWRWRSNDLLNREHLNGFSLCSLAYVSVVNLEIDTSFHTGDNCELGVWWTLTCCSKLFFKRKDLSHWEHLWGLGFSALWIITCLCRELLWENDFEHWKQVNGFSPVWTLKWSFKLPDCANAFSQWPHL